MGLLPHDPLLALDFDLAIMLRGLQHENEQVEKARGKTPRRSADPASSLAVLKQRIDSGEVELAH